MLGALSQSSTTTPTTNYADDFKVDDKIVHTNSGSGVVIALGAGTLLFGGLYTTCIHALIVDFAHSVPRQVMVVGL